MSWGWWWKPWSIYFDDLPKKNIVFFCSYVKLPGAYCSVHHDKIWLCRLRFWGTPPILDGFSTSFPFISHTKIAHGDIPHFPTHPYSHLKIWDMMAIKKVDMILIWANDLIYVERATIGDTMFCPALLHELKQYFSNLCLEIEPEPLIPWHLQGVFFLLSLMIEVFSCFTNGNPQLCWSSVVWPHYFQTSSYLSYSLDPEEVVLGGPASAYNICTTHKSLQVQWVWVRI